MSHKNQDSITDPYGSLEFAIGNEDDFWCFDYALHDDGTVTLHAVINSETGSFIQNAEEPIRVPAAQAVEEAKRLTDEAINWICGEGIDEPIEHDTEGWNQDPTYFQRSVEAAVTRSKDSVPRIVQATIQSEEDLDWQARNAQE